MRNDLPKGFSAGTAQASFKKAGRDDLAILVSDTPCVLAALFTQNKFCAAPVQVDKKILAQGKPVRAVVANSGQSNACTGEEGLRNCGRIQQMAAEALGIAPDEVLLISTGVIGAQFDMGKWALSFPEAARTLGERDAEGFTRAIMTTDAFPKFAARSVTLSGGEIRLCVMAKGAGMICPNMATMLCVVLTDAAVAREAWQDIFARAVNSTFNRVSVDGDTSTNDTILALANGASGIEAKSADDLALLEKSLTEILDKVSTMLVRDGEGAKKVMHIVVRGAASENDARLAARAIGNSQLVKTAVYGGDANWGRILNAVGYSGANFNPGDVRLSLCGIERFRDGQPVNDDKEEELAKLLAADDVQIDVTLGDGQFEYSFKASDLGHEYVSLNSDYRS